MTKPFKILASAPPRADENLRGYLLRISELNGYENPLWLRRAAGLEFLTASSMDHVQALAQILRRKPEEMVHMALLAQPGEASTHRPFLQTVVHRHLIELQDVRLCPTCLSDDPYMRLLWDFRPLPCCPVHETHFATDCPKCRKPISKHRPGVTTCVCGHDVTDIACDRATDAEIWLAKLMAAKAIGTELPTSPDRLSPIVAMTLDELARLTAFIGATTGRTTSTGRFLRYDADLANWKDRAHQAAEFLYQWPGSARPFFDEIRTRLGIEGQDHKLSGAFRTVYRHATTALVGPAYDFFRQELANYIDRAWPAGGVRAKNTRLTQYLKDGQASRVTGTEAQKVLDISRDQLISWIETGRLSGTIIRLPTKTQIFVERSSLEVFNNAPVEKINLKKARDKLGLSTAVVVAMARFSILEPVRHLAVSKVVKHVTLASVDALLDLFSRVHPQPGCDEIEMIDLLTHRRRAEIWFPALVAALRAGEIWLTVGRDAVRGLKACRFNRSEIAHLIQRSMPEDTPVAVHVIAARLMWPPEIVGHFIDCQVVAPKHVNANRKGKTVSQEGYAHLAKLYGSAGQLGRERGISAAMVRKLLVEAGVQPVIPPHGVARTTFYLFDRNDTADVLGPPRSVVGERPGIHLGTESVRTQRAIVVARQQVPEAARQKVLHVSLRNDARPASEGLGQTGRH